jgi:hypothetical protein
MAIVLNKPKPKAAAAVAPDPFLSEFAAKIDEVGRLEGPALKTKEKIKKLQDDLKPYAKAQKELQESMDGLGDDDDKLEELGVEFKVEAGAKGSSRKVTDMKRIHEILGDDLFYDLATITLTNLDKYLIEPQREEVTETSRTNRTLKIIARK